MGMEGLLINNKQTDLLLTIQKQSRPKSLTALAKDSGYNTWTQAYKVIEKFAEKGLVEMEKKGRMKLVTLTERGREVCRHLVNLRYILI